MHSPLIILSVIAAALLILWAVVGGTKRDRTVARQRRDAVAFEQRAAQDPDWGLTHSAASFGLALDLAGDTVAAQGQSGGRFTGSRVSVQDAAQVNGDPVLRKMLLFGAAGAFFPDRDGREVYVTVEGDGFALVTRVGGSQVDGVRRFAAVWNTRSGALDRSAVAGGDVASWLAELGRMHGAGRLTDAEFTAAKEKLLGG